MGGSPLATLNIKEKRPNVNYAESITHLVFIEHSSIPNP